MIIIDPHHDAVVTDTIVAIVGAEAAGVLFLLIKLIGMIRDMRAKKQV